MQLDATGLVLLIGGIGALCVTLTGLAYKTLTKPLQDRVAKLEIELSARLKSELDCEKRCAAMEAENRNLQREIDQLRKEIDELKAVNRNRQFNEE